MLHCTTTNAVTTLTLNRAEKHNALDPQTIDQLHAAVRAIARDDGVRVVVLTGAGTSFCAGADIGHMRSMLHASERENIADATALAACMRALDELDRPVIARVNGNAFGGGLGLIACADIAIAVDTAKFALSEVKLGLVPAVISPFVLAAIGMRQARRLMLTGAMFDAKEAARIGLIHDAVAASELDRSVEQHIEALLAAGPHALRAVKRLLRTLREAADRDTVQAHTTQLLAQLRAGPEGQEGLTAFLERRDPNWRSQR